MRFNHLTLVVSDLSASLRFYRALGLRLMVLAEPRYARLIFPEGDETLSLEVTGQPAAASRAQVYFECRDIDQRYGTLVKAGMVFEQAPTDMPYLWREAWLRDPDGHQIRLFDSGGNRLNPPWRLPESLDD